MVLTHLLAFAGAALLLAMVPGPSLALVLRQTLRGGRRHAVATTLGNATGLAFWATSAALGLSVLVATSELAYQAIRIVGAVLLVALGVRSLRRAGRPDPVVVDPDTEPVADTARAEPGGARGLAGYRTGILVSLANPKSAVFAMSVLPQFSAPHPGLTEFLLLVAVWVTVSSAWYVAVSWAVSRVRAVFARAAVRRRLEQVAGVVLIGFGLRLATDAR